MKKWLLLIYKIPREPTAGRVFVWRKLKQIGALAIQDAVWILPQSKRSAEHFQWLAAEINELGGETMVWETEPIDGNQSDELQKRFTDLIEAEYKEIEIALKRKDRDLTALSKRFQEVGNRDFFKTEIGIQVREKLLKASEGRKK